MFVCLVVQLILSKNCQIIKGFRKQGKLIAVDN